MADISPHIRSFLDQFMAEVRENAYSSAVRSFAAVDADMENMSREERVAFNQGVNVGVLAVLKALTNNHMIVPPNEGMVFNDDD